MCMNVHNNNNNVHTIIIIRALIQWELFCARHKPCMSCSINSCRGSMRVGTVVRPTLSMKKLRHREGKSFLKVTQPVRVRLVCEPRSLFSVQFSSVQSLSRVRLFATPWIAALQASLSITNSQSSLRLASIESVMPSSHLILSRPPSSPAPNPSQHQRLFQWVNSSHEVAKVLEFQL